MDETRGIDILGDIMESSSISINRDLYGNLHGMGHVFISYAHDPDNRHLESFGVIGKFLLKSPFKLFNVLIEFFKSVNNVFL